MIGNDAGELLPCPFCGGPAVNVAGEYITCGSPAFLTCAGRSVRADAEAWNTRTTPASAGVLVEALADIRLSIETAAGCDEGIEQDDAYSEVLSFGGSSLASAYDRICVLSLAANTRQALSTTATPASDGVSEQGRDDALIGRLTSNIETQRVLIEQTAIGSLEREAARLAYAVMLDARRVILTPAPDRFGEGYRAGVEASAKVAEDGTSLHRRSNVKDWRDGYETACNYVAHAIRALQPATGYEA